MDVLKNPPPKANLLVIKYAVSLLLSDAYFERYYEILSEIGSGPGQPGEAFNQLEDELFLLTGEHRYAEYAYFRQCRSRYVGRLSKKRRT